MAGLMVIPMVRDTDLMRGDVVRLEVGGVVQPDRVQLWDERRRRMGFGFGTMGLQHFGRGALFGGFGSGPFGLGVMGFGADVAEHVTVNRFAAGDYAVRVRVEDEVGNVGAYGAAVTIKHRPTPDAVDDLRVEAGVLKWSWTDG